MSRRAVAVVVAGLVATGAGATIAFFELVGNPFEPLPPVASIQPMPTVDPTTPPLVLAAADEPSSPARSEIEAVLGEAIDGSDLGERTGVIVTDLHTAEVRYERGADSPLTPASTLKLLTAAAVLEVLGPDARFATSVVSGADPAEIVLVGGGDPTLSTSDPPMPGSTSLAELARQTAAALLDAGVDQVRLGFDDSLFSGPAVNPAWPSTYVSGGVVAPVSALAVDGGRTTPGLAARATDPALAAARTFADLLSEHGVAADASPIRTAQPAGAVPVAETESVPLADIVEYVIASSNNDMAEILARHVALGMDRPGSAEGAAAAIVEVLDELGVSTTGATILDGSGLARTNAIPARALTDLLAIAADPGHPQLRPVITGLPVAAFNGTLQERVEDAPGQVRAKTGTLTGVHSLAGVIAGDNGVTYAFALLANDMDNALRARAALDAVAAVLAGCGCATPAAETG